MHFLTRLYISFLVLSALAASACGQTAPALQPQDGYLSPDHYLNRYFGLSIALPRKMTPIPIPEVQGVTHWLLGLQSDSGKTAVTLIITADPPPKKPDARSVLRSDFSATDASKPVAVSLGAEPFWRIAAPPKPEPDASNTVEYAGVVRDYLLKIRVRTTSGAVPDTLISAIESATFVPPSEVESRRSSDMVPYFGPALPQLGSPTARMTKLEDGTIAAHVYHNHMLGFDFSIPDALQVQPTATLQSDFDTSRSTLWANASDTQIAHLFSVTCTRVLLFADDGSHPKNGHFPSVVMITALDPVCLQGARFPISATDTEAVQSVARALASLVDWGRPGKDLSGRAYRVEGRAFVNLTGNIYGTEPGTGLQIPNRIRMIATELNGYWAVWTFIAPDSKTLDRLSATPVRFFSLDNESQRRGRSEFLFSEQNHYR